MTDQTTAIPAPADLKDLLDRLTRAFPELPPQLRLAAKVVLEQPQDVAMLSMRGLATSAEVPPSTMVRLAKVIGFASYDEFRAIFQQAIRAGGSDLVSRAEWLQRLPEGGRAAEVGAAMATAILGNIESAYRANSMEVIGRAAELLRTAARVTIVGVGGMHAIAAYFHYVARMALPDVRLAQPAMASMIDELAAVGDTDVVVILSVEPYATETVRTAEFVARRGAQLLAITYSRTAPIAPLAAELLLVATTTPQFFPSQAATIALIETLMAAIVSRGDRSILDRIDRVDRHRREEGIYWRAKR